MKKAVIKGETICGTFIMLLAGFFFLWSFSAPKEAMNWPRIALFITIMLSIVMMVLAQKGIGVAKPSVFDWKGTTFRMMISTLVYIVLLNPLGFLILTPLWCYVVFRLNGYRKTGTSIIVSLIITILVFWIFKRLLFVPVPLGILSELIY